MRTTLFILLSFASLVTAEPLAERPGEPMEKTRYWAILEERWRMIEPQLFATDGAKHVGIEVRFQGATVSIGKPVVVRTSAGTTARVSHIPKADMDLIREFRRPPSQMTVLGTITAIDPATRTISIKGGEIRPGH